MANKNSSANCVPITPQMRLGHALRKFAQLQRQADLSSDADVQTNVAKGERDVVFASQKDVDDFNLLGTSIRGVRTLTVHVNADSLDAWTDDSLAMALSHFRPRLLHNDHRRPLANHHSLDRVTIIAEGSMLFTRYDYKLVSPVNSGDVAGDMCKLLTNELSSEQKAEMPYVINTTEKATSTALLAIRGVYKVVVKGYIEASFAKALKAALRMPVGADLSTTIASIFRVPIDAKVAETQSLDGVFHPEFGLLLSQACPSNLLSDVKYSTIDFTPKAWEEENFKNSDNKKVILDQLMLLSAEILDLNEEDYIQAAVRPRGYVSAKQKHRHMPVALSHGNVIRTRRARQATAMVCKEAVSPPLRMQNMIRYGRKVQTNADLGTGEDFEVASFIDTAVKTDLPDNDQWLVLTGNGAEILMGWRVKPEMFLSDTESSDDDMREDESDMKTFDEGSSDKENGIEDTSD